MSNLPITSLPLTISLTGSEDVPLVQGGATKRVAARNFFGIPLTLISTPTPSTDYTVPLRQVSTGLPFATTISEFMTALHGVPAGGTTGQILAKESNADYDTGWVSAGTVFSVGLAMPSIFTVTGSPVTGSGTLTATLNTETANTVFSGPSSGSAATPAFRALVGADLPNPSATTLGGVKSLAAVSHQFLTQIGTDGSVSQAQPAFSDISGTATVAQGGTGLTSGTSGGILGFTGSTTLSSSIALTANAIVLGGGAGATPVPMGSLGTTTTVLHGNAAGAPTFGAVSLTADVSGILPSANGGTGVNNGSSTITLGSSLTTSGAFASTFTMTGITSVTFPTSGTLATTGGASIPSVAQGDLLYGSGTNTLAALSKSATATRYLANTGTTNNPAWDQVNLTNGVTGTLPVGNGGTGISNPTAHDLLIGNGSSAMTQLAPSSTSGIPLVSQGASSDPAYSTAVVAGGGTGLTSGTSGGILGFTATGTLASSVLLTTNALLLGGGAGATPSALGSLGTTTTVLHGNAAGAPTFGAVSLTADITGTLAVGNGGTGATSLTAHGVLIGNGSSAVAVAATSATSGISLVSQGASSDPVFGTTVVAGGGTGLTSATAYAVLCGGTTSTAALQSIASVGTAGQILTSAGAAALPTMAGITTALDTLSSTQGSVLFRGSSGWSALAPSSSGRVLTTNGAGLDPTWSAVSGTGTVTSVTAAGILTGGTITTVGTINLNASIAPQGRITLASGVPVMATSQSGQTTVYYTPYQGNLVPIYDGTNLVPTAVAEVSQATTDSTKSPAAVAASKVYDLFVWNDSGTIRCTRGPAWTNSTTRGYTFTMVNGILLNTSAITNGPAASRGTWVGTIASNASSTIDFIFGGAASSGLAGVFNVWNCYNRVTVGCAVQDTAVGYTYTSSTIRQAHASTAMQVSFVIGAQEDAVTATYNDLVTGTAVAGSFMKIGIGLDSITAYSVNGFYNQQVAATYSGTLATPILWNPGIGTHYVAALQSSDNSNANTFNAGQNGTLAVTLRM